MPTVQNLSKVARKCGVRGRTELDEREPMMNENKNPKEGGGGGPLEGEEGRWHHSSGQKPSRGREGGGGGVDDNSSGIQISITGGVEEMVHGSNYCDFFFDFLLNHMHLFKVQRQHSALTLWPAKTVPSSPQETSKPPSPSGMRPTAHLTYRLTKFYEHTCTPEGSRKERNKQEGEENP